MIENIRLTLEYFRGHKFSARLFDLSQEQAALDAAELRKEGYIVRVLDNTGREVNAPEKDVMRGQITDLRR